MKALLLKDLLVLVKQLRLYLLILLILLLCGNNYFAVALVVTIYLPLTALAYDEQAKWDEYALMLPYSTADLVFGKYLLGYAALIFALGLALLFKLVMSFFTQSLFSIDLNALLLMSSLSLTLIALTLPNAFKYGVQKSRILTLLTAFILLIIVNACADGINLNSAFFPWLLFACSLALNVCSYYLSLYFKRVK